MDMYSQSLAIVVKEYGQENGTNRTQTQGLPAVFFGGDYSGRRDQFRRELEINEKSLGEKTPTLPVDLASLALLYSMQGKKAAEAVAQQSAEALF